MKMLKLMVDTMPYKSLSAKCLQIMCPSSYKCKLFRTIQKSGFSNLTWCNEEEKHLRQIDNYSNEIYALAKLKLSF